MSSLFLSHTLKFLKGILVSARAALVASSLMVDGILVPSFSFLSDQKFSYWPSTIDRVLCPTHQRDPYESRLVRVGTSGMEGGGEAYLLRGSLHLAQLLPFTMGCELGKRTPTPMAIPATAFLSTGENSYHSPSPG